MGPGSDGGCFASRVPEDAQFGSFYTIDLKGTKDMVLIQVLVTED